MPPRINPQIDFTTIRRMRPMLGTFVHIEVEANSSHQRLREIVDEAFADIARVERLMSFHHQESDLGRINRSRTGVQVNPWTIRVLRLALELARRSQHRFNPTLGGAIVEAGRLPCPDDNQGWIPAGTVDDIRIDGDTVTRLRPVLLTLDGIAKGWAVDRAIARLRARGVRQAVVNAGGDWRAIGRGQGVYVRHQQTLHYLGELIRGACATSAIHRQPERFPGLMLDHAGQRIDASAWPRESQEHCWTILAPQAWLADGLTKVAANLDPARAEQHINQLGGRLVRL